MTILNSCENTDLLSFVFFMSYYVFEHRGICLVCSVVLYHYPTPTSLQSSPFHGTTVAKYWEKVVSTNELTIVHNQRSNDWPGFNILDGVWESYQQQYGTKKSVRLTLLNKRLGCHQIYMSRLMTKPIKWLCAQRRLRSAWASAQSDQRLRCALNG